MQHSDEDPLVFLSPSAGEPPASPPSAPSSGPAVGEGGPKKKRARKSSKAAARKPARAAAAPKTPSRRAKAPPRATWKVVKVGLQLGDSRTVIAASKNGDAIPLKKDVFTNLVGFLKTGGASLQRLWQGREALPADAAMKFIRQMDLKQPIRAGRVIDVKVCRQFAAHIASAIDPGSTSQLWAVASVPAEAGPEEWEQARRGLGGAFPRLVLVPEPYLAAEGMEGDKAFRVLRVLEELTRHALVIDIGSVATNLCLVRGQFPTAADQIRLDRGGNQIDEKIRSNALVHCPNLTLTPKMARGIKEEQAFVGASVWDAGRSPPGSSDLLALTEVIRKACEDLLERVVEAAGELLGRCEPAEAAAIAKDIILTGGGSRIRNFAPSLQERLRQRGHTEARVLLPDDDRRLVARGARRLAEKLTDEEWNTLSSSGPEAMNAWQGSGPGLVTSLGPPPGPSAPARPSLDALVRDAAPADPAPSKNDEYTLDDVAELELFKGR